MELTSWRIQGGGPWILSAAPFRLSVKLSDAGYVRTEIVDRGREKTFPRTNKGGRTMFARPPFGMLFFFVGKFLGFLNPFSQKGFKRSTRQSLVTSQVRTESATLEPRDLKPTLTYKRRPYEDVQAFFL